MVDEQITCKWAALSLSTIAELFLRDLLEPRSAYRVRHQLVAVSTTSGIPQAQKWLNEKQIPGAVNVKVYTSWQGMLATADFDVVYISTPHPLHYSMARVALENQRNVLVEKPATMNRPQYEILASLARAHNVVLMEAMWTRYQPLAEYLQNDLLPRIGEVRRVFSDFAFPIWSPDLPSTSRWLDKDAGAGCLLDMGVYALTWADIALNGLGVSPTMATRVVYASTANIPGLTNDVDDLNTIVISKVHKKSKQQEAFAIVTTSMTMPGSTEGTTTERLRSRKLAPAVRIEGTKAQIAIPFPPIRPEIMQVQWYDQNAPGMEREEVIESPLEGWGMWYQADRIGRVVHERKSQNPRTGEVIGEEATLRVLQWMDDARYQAGIEYPPELERL